MDKDKLETLDYNTQREKLQMPEYGRHIQKMVEYVASLEDKDKRNEQIQAVVNVMGILNPQLRDTSDFKHKLWDHVQIISDFSIDIDSPYPLPTKEEMAKRPNKIERFEEPIKAACYGRNIQNMINNITKVEDPEVKTIMIKTIAEYMRQQYLIWNKDTVADETIFNDMVKLSDGKIEIPQGLTLSSGQSYRSSKPHGNSNKRMDQQRNGNNGKKNFKYKKNGSI